MHNGEARGHPAPVNPSPVPRPGKREGGSRYGTAREQDATLSRAASAAVDAIAELQEIQQEYLDWQENLPENLESSPVSDKLTRIVDIDLDGALDTINEADGADLPLGFGRD